MMNLVQLNYDDLQAVLKNCLREAINEFKELPTQPEPPERIGLIEACQLTGLSKSKLYKLSMSDEIPTIGKFGRRLVFSRKQLLTWIEANTVKSKDTVNESIQKSASKKV